MAASAFLLISCVLCFSQAHRVANLVLLPDAVNDGAVCLDGSAPGYYIDKTSVNRWIIHLEGGGWCYNKSDCYYRASSWLGSSTYWNRTSHLRGFLNNDPDVNPEFANYSVVFVPYCDGASFSGNVNDPITVNDKKIYFRGHPILNAVLSALIQKEQIDKAEAIILTGCSAGGLSTYLHLDYVQSMFPNIKVHGLADAGYFIDAANIHGEMYIRGQYQHIFEMQNCSGGVNSDCIRSKEESERWQCFMAQYTYPYIKTPIFVFNAEYDTWQLQNILQVGCKAPNCNESQMQLIARWRTMFLQTLQPVIRSTTNGLFTDACIQHCQSLADRTWSKIMVKNQTAHDTFVDWLDLKGTGIVRAVDDHTYPHNPTCGKPHIPKG
ncbi:uncharacterized protein LOC134188416 [Corticium candelabrum]|uniref:uncharacterized protein LOC134188416 n=1 Tax=Corticium candelabrum TaxID=121492 RepID=UPI002E2661A3|nr:uncharacterized protein LOC134188416 [Corticium candelabrum]